MGRIIVTEFVSLDGVMEAPGGGEDYKHAGWTFEINSGEEGNKFMDQKKSMKRISSQTVGDGVEILIYEPKQG